MVTDIKVSELNRILFKAVSRTYYKELLKTIPGKGRLGDALDIMMTSDGVSIYAEDKAGEILTYLNFGTKGPYPIRPKNKKALAFKMGGEQVFAKEVMHPGIEARLFVQKVINDSTLQQQFESIYQQELEKLIASKQK